MVSLNADLPHYNY